MAKFRISGIFNVDKPAGLTSHDVVVAIRRASAQRRVGHAGTLDPTATGVLLICLGEATRVAEYLMAGRKVYRARIHLGVTTDTYDATGQVLSAAEVNLSRAEIERAASSFIGQVQQRPPMYSAVKREGQPLYSLARRGIEVEREARTVEIYDFRITGWSPPFLSAEITCSKGTYIRSLAHDLGQVLGCGAHLAELVRVACGSFTLADAVPLSRLVDSLAAGNWQEYLLPLDVALSGYPAWTVDEETAKRIRHGQAVLIADLPADAEPGTYRRVYSPQGTFLALLRYDDSRRRWQPDKVFVND